MSSIAVIYYSASGNTAAMAEAVVEGVESMGAEANIFEVSEFLIDDLENYDAFAFGCPASGDEELEEFEFEPFFSNAIEIVGDRPVAIFGSYSNGDGAWMRKWEDVCDDMNLNLVASGVIAEDYPDSDAIEACQELGEILVENLNEFY